MDIYSLKTIASELRETNNELRVANAEADLIDIDLLYFAIERISAHQFAMRYKVRKEDVLNRTLLWKREQEAHIKWLKDLPKVVSDYDREHPMEKAWQRDIDAWRARGLNCD